MDENKIYSLASIFLVDDKNIEDFILRGGKIVYIAEEKPGRLYHNPAVTMGGILLPPSDAIEAELNNDIQMLQYIYMNYLSSWEVERYIAILVAACYQNIPIGITFGYDEKNMRFPDFFLQFMELKHGITIGRFEDGHSFLNHTFTPMNLAMLYNMDIVDYESFMLMHNQYDIHPDCVMKMATEVNPSLKSTSFEDYYKYFNEIKMLTTKLGFVPRPAVVKI